MPELLPRNAEDVRKIVEARLDVVEAERGVKDTVTIEWRGSQLTIPVISMPVDVLSYNPGTHRIRAQRSLDPARDHELDIDPYGPAAQKYLHDLLMGDPTDPSKIDPAFEALKADLGKHGQSEPGIINRAGVLINGNTRRAALQELGHEDIRVAVLPQDAAVKDQQTVELSLQLRKDYKRDYSFMNFLLAIDERIQVGVAPEKIQSEFRIRPRTFDRSIWILAAVRELIQRSQVQAPGGRLMSMRLVDFEIHQGKLEELHRAYTALKAKAPDDAEALREQRLLAIALDKSKTDVRLIEPRFVETYMGSLLPDAPAASARSVSIPGTSIAAPAPSPKVGALTSLTDEVLKARSVAIDAGSAPPELVKEAGKTLEKVTEALDAGLDKAGRNGRVVKKRLAPVDRLSDANEDLELSITAVAEARSTGSFDAGDLDEALLSLKSNLVQLARIATRDTKPDLEGLRWLVSVAGLPDTETP
jgi:hypothetical protein